MNENIGQAHGGNPVFHATTIIAVKKDGKVAMAGDGQVSLGNTIMKGNARKVRSLAGGSILAGFAGSAADGFTLFERFEAKLGENNRDMARAAVELAKDWRMDRALRRLEAMIILADANQILLLSGNGDLIEPEKDVLAIGSGGNYAYAAALAFMEREDLAARDVAEKSLRIASEICVFTNSQFVVEEIR